MPMRGWAQRQGSRGKHATPSPLSPPPLSVPRLRSPTAPRRLRPRPRRRSGREWPPPQLLRACHPPLRPPTHAQWRRHSHLPSPPPPPLTPRPSSHRSPPRCCPCCHRRSRSLHHAPSSPPPPPPVLISGTGSSPPTPSPAPPRSSSHSSPPSLPLPPHPRLWGWRRWQGQCWASPIPPFARSGPQWARCTALHPATIKPGWHWRGWWGLGHRLAQPRPPPPAAAQRWRGALGTHHGV